MSTAGGLRSTMRAKSFAVLWLATAFAFLAQGMLPVASQWYLLHLPGGIPLVPWVQAALTLPVAILAIPVGVLADRLDRRRMIIFAQLMILASETGIVFLLASGGMEGPALLAILALIAIGMIVSMTAFNSVIPDIVERPFIPFASALVAIAINSARIVGPALAGLLVATSGVRWAFAASLLPTAVSLIAMVFWDRRPPTPKGRERLVAAAWSGLWFARHSPHALKAITRAFLLTCGLTGLLSLLPLLVSQAGGTSVQLGLLFGGQGVGAVLGACTIAWLRRVTGPNAVVAIGFAAAGGSVAVSTLVTSLGMLGLAVLMAGWSWIVVLTSLQSEMQLFLPAWVRVRGISMFLCAVYAGQGFGSLLLGWVANQSSVQWAVACGAVALVAGFVLARTWPIRDIAGLDLSPVNGWQAPELSLNPRTEEGTVHVRVTYVVAPESEQSFLTLMYRLRRIRLRAGAVRWELLRDAVALTQFTEEFTLGSWDDYERQMLGRAIAADRHIEEEAAGLATRQPAGPLCVSSRSGQARLSRRTA